MGSTLPIRREHHRIPHKSQLRGGFRTVCRNGVTRGWQDPSIVGQVDFSLCMTTGVTKVPCRKYERHRDAKGKQSHLNPEGSPKAQIPALCSYPHGVAQCYQVLLESLGYPAPSLDNCTKFGITEQESEVQESCSSQRW